VKCIEWLNRHPIDDGGELYGLEAKIAKYRIVAEKAAVERDNNDKDLSGGKKWQGIYPMLCMMHTLVDHSEIKRAYLTRHDLPSEQIGIENRNTAAVVAQNVWQLIADKWNDVLFTPSTNLGWEIHLEFHGIPQLFRFWTF
jgi:hypothetical protein